MVHRIRYYLAPYASASLLMLVVSRIHQFTQCRCAHSPLTPLKLDTNKHRQNYMLAMQGQTWIRPAPYKGTTYGRTPSRGRCDFENFVQRSLILTSSDVPPPFIATFLESSPLPVNVYNMVT